ncbi:MAG: hypothetical protein OXH00_21665 [Candidatus Poribacteria bacterium]|nr:hypothetical protein [Candidatus Poribacteria bacterium]
MRNNDERILSQRRGHQNARRRHATNIVKSTTDVKSTRSAKCHIFGQNRSDACDDEDESLIL